MFTLEQQVGQRLMVGFEGLTAPAYLLEWLAEGRIGGVILFQRNIDTPEQLAALTASLHAAASHPILISIDQEGGEVARLRGQFTEAPSAMALAAGGGAHAEAVAYTLGQEMRALGINQDYAPVVDITYNAENPTVGTRSPGADAATISRIAAAQVQGYQRAGVAATAKHFPGLGDTAVDTHVALATITAPIESLQADLAPYRAVIDAGIASIMTTHTVFAALDADLPATLSPVVVPRLLREQLGYDGVVTTDCMEMKAIADNHPPQKSAVLAALASCDLILVSHTRAAQEAAYAGLLAAARDGTISADNMARSLARIAALKARFAVTDAPQTRDIKSPAHTAIMLEAAKAGIQTLRDDAGLLPLPSDARVVLVEFASIHDSEVFDATGHTGFSTKFAPRFPDARIITLATTATAQDLDVALAAARDADITVLATRSAHLNHAQLGAARRILDAAPKSVLLALRNPYDAGALPDADTVLLSFGGAEPQLEAVVMALAGDFMPAAQSPVDVLT